MNPRSLTPDSKNCRAHSFLGSQGSNQECHLETTIMAPYFDFQCCLAFLLIVSAVSLHHLKSWDFVFLFPKDVSSVYWEPNEILFTDSDNDLLKFLLILLHLLPKVTRILDLNHVSLVDLTEIYRVGCFSPKNK